MKHRGGWRESPLGWDHYWSSFCGEWVRWGTPGRMSVLYGPSSTVDRDPSDISCIIAAFPQPQGQQPKTSWPSADGDESPVRFRPASESNFCVLPGFFARVTVKARWPILAEIRLRGKLGRPFVCF